VKSLFLFGLSALFMAAAAKPFVHKTDTARSSWADYRSYPYAVWADEAARKADWLKTVTYYTMALQRNPHDKRYTAGVLQALHQLRLLQQSIDAQRRPVPSPPTKLQPHHIVRHDIPTDTQDRLQQTAWRGPIVSFRTELEAETATALAATVSSETRENTALALATVAAPVLRANSPYVSPEKSSDAQLAYLNMLPARQEKRWSLNSSSTYRSRALPLVLGGASEFGGSQSGAEARWRLGGDHQRPLQLAASTFVSNRNNGGFRPDSTQAVIGVRYKPFEKTNIVVGADQLVKVGRQSRSALAVRLMGDKGDNYDGPDDKNRWFHWHAGFDTALIGAKSRDIFASAETRAGIGFRLNQNISLTPYVGINALHQQAGGKQTLVEAGPGLWLRTRLSDSSRIDLKLAYRMNVAGNTDTRDGVVAQVAIGF
jgi:hypothetical protein